VNTGLEYPLYLEEYDLRNREKCFEELQTRANEIQASIDLEKGPLMKLGLFQLDDGDRLLIVVHHLVIDGVSWRILFEDIETLYSRYIQGGKFALPLKTDSFKLWSEKLSAYANSKTFLKEKIYWQKIEAMEVHPIPKDFYVDDNYIKDTTNVSFTLGNEQTGLLLTKVNEAFRTEINDILLTALGMAVKKTFGQDRVLIALEGHGREQILEDMDIGRTVGWFTSVYPVLVDNSYAGDLGRQIKEIKETLRRIPNKGIGYGILKYLTREENKKEIEFKLKPQISFNYLGQFDTDVKQISSFEIAKESGGNSRSLKNRREYILDVSGMMSGDRLTMTISYNKTHFKTGTMTSLIRNFKSEIKHLIALCSSKDKTGFTPADFTYKGLSMEKVDELAEKYFIEDIYTLTPMQEGMLFHSLYGASSSAYFVQISFRFHGELNIPFLKKSLEHLFLRHDVLRTVFIYEGFDRPLQIVLKERKPVFFFKDLQEEATGKEKGAFIREYKERDRRCFFDLSKDVLLRTAVIRVDAEQYEFIWSNHHILMDGWCREILFTELFEIYRSYRENRPFHLPFIKPYRNYIQWLENVDKKASKEYWEKYLQGFNKFTGIPRKNKQAPGPKGMREESFECLLGKDSSHSLSELAASRRVTLNTVFQVLWGVLLGIYNDTLDVVFGTVVSGRPPEILGVETMVGLFINNVPVRIRFDENTRFWDLVKKVQQEVLESKPHHYYSLAEIQASSMLKQDLFDHVLVFENFPSINRPFELESVQQHEYSNYDLTLGIIPGEPIKVKFLYNTGIYEPGFIEQVSLNLKEMINTVITKDDIRVKAFSISHNFLVLESNVFGEDMGEFVF